MKEKGLSQQERAEEAKAQVVGAENGVFHAMQSLEEMELTFMRDVKRRKLQVEQSFVKETSDDAPPIFKPRSSGESRALKLDRILLTPEKDDDQDGQQEDWEPAADGEEDVNEDAPEFAERGAKRAPAINSDFLPLPWKGRLGYVCTYHEHTPPPLSTTC